MQPGIGHWRSKAAGTLRRGRSPTWRNSKGFGAIGENAWWRCSCDRSRSVGETLGRATSRRMATLQTARRTPSFRAEQKTGFPSFADASVLTSLQPASSTPVPGDLWPTVSRTVFTSMAGEFAPNNEPRTLTDAEPRDA